MENLSFSIGNTSSTGPFSIAMLVYQRVEGFNPAVARNTNQCFAVLRSGRVLRSGQLFGADLEGNLPFQVAVMNTTSWGTNLMCWVSLETITWMNEKKTRTQHTSLSVKDLQAKGISTGFLLLIFFPCFSGTWGWYSQHRARGAQGCGVFIKYGLSKKARWIPCKWKWVNGSTWGNPKNPEFSFEKPIQDFMVHSIFAWVLCAFFLCWKSGFLQMGRSIWASGSRSLGIHGSKPGLYIYLYPPRVSKFSPPGLFLVVKGLKFQTLGGFR